MYFRNMLGLLTVIGLLFSGSLSNVAAQESASREAAGQEEDAPEAASEEEPAALSDRLVEIARARVEQHEKRIKTLEKIGELRQDFARLAIEKMKRRMEALQADLQAAAAEEAQQVNEYSRVERLAEKNAVDEREVFLARRRRGQAEAAVARGRSAIAQVKAELQTMELEHQQHQLESALRLSEATLALLDAQEALARARNYQRIRRRRSLSSAPRYLDGPRESPSDSSARSPEQ